MSVVRVQAQIPRDTNLPEDVSTNTWHFTTATSPASGPEAVAILDALEDFYGAIAGKLSAVCASPMRLEAYDLSLPAPRVPILFREFAITPGTTSYPEEVAVCCTYQSAPASGQPQARRRGRVFIGPVITLGDLADGRMRIPEAQRTVFGNAMKALKQADVDSNLFTWVVASRVGVAANAEPNVSVVTDGWVDDAYDVIRSRGPAPTARTIWTMP